jgi:hypothetical protein
MPQFVALSNTAKGFVSDHLVVEQFFSNKRNQTASARFLEKLALT